MAAKETPFFLVIKAIDKATGPIRAFSARLKVLTEPTKKVGAALSNTWSKAGDLGARLAGLALGAGAAFGAIVKSAMDAGDALGEVADRVGLTVDVFASLQHAAAQADVSQEDFTTAMDKFNKSLGELKAGGGPILAFLSKVSPALLAQVKGAKSTEEALSLMADAFQRIDDPAKSAALASAMFGKSGLQMGRFLHQGSAAIQEQQRRYMALVGSQEEFARRSGSLDNATRETGLAFTGLRNVIAAGLFPALEKLAGKLTEFMTANRERFAAWAERAGAALQAWLDGGGFERLVESLGKVATAIGRVVAWLGPWGSALAVGAYMVSPLIAAVASLGASLVNLGIAAFPLVKGAALAAWPAISAVGSAVGGLAVELAAIAAPFLPFLAALASLMYLGKVIRENWEPLAFIFKDWGNSLRWAVLDAWAAVKPILEKLSGFFGGNNAFSAALSLGNAGAAWLTPQPGAPLAITAPAARAGAVSTEARVSVDFANLPRGARVSTEPNSSQPVDLSLGYSMIGG